MLTTHHPTDSVKGRKGIVAMQATVRQKIATAFVVAHVLLVACGAAGFYPGKDAGLLGKCFTIYGHFTGSSNGYGFFSPNVADQLVTRVTAEDFRGVRRVKQFGGRDTETDRRISTMMMVFANINNPQLHGLSLAAYTLGRNPSARTVTVAIYHRCLPTMAEYRQGERPSLEEIYRGTYGRRSRVQFQPRPQ